MLLLFILCGVVSTSLAIERHHYSLENAEILFEDFIQTHSKTYNSNTEKLRRFEIFKENLREINQKNTEKGAVFGINHFSDLTQTEFTQKYANLKPSKSKSCKVVTDDDIKTNDAPAEFDWVKEGAVTAVKDQGGCEAYWAFCTTGNTEGQYFIKNRKLIDFSEQQLVDCSKRNGCSGGNLDEAIKDLIVMGGLQTESTYPYVGCEQDCKFNSSKVSVKVTGCINYNLRDEDKLKEVLAKKGPIIIAVSSSNWYQYAGGILPRSECDGKYLDHAALLVGYGTEDGEDYWIVKNSFGAKWGNKGYIWLKRGENTCGLMNDSNFSVEL